MYRKQDKTRASQNLNPWSLSLLDSNQDNMELYCLDNIAIFLGFEV